MWIVWVDGAFKNIEISKEYESSVTQKKMFKLYDFDSAITTLVVIQKFHKLM